jgi:hypothetical protein
MDVRKEEANEPDLKKPLMLHVTIIDPWIDLGFIIGAGARVSVLLSLRL